MSWCTVPNDEAVPQFLRSDPGVAQPSRPSPVVLPQRALPGRRPSGFSAVSGRTLPAHDRNAHAGPATPRAPFPPPTPMVRYSQDTGGNIAWSRPFFTIWRGDPPAPRRGSFSRDTGSPSPSTKSQQAPWAPKRPGRWCGNTKSSGSKWDQQSKSGIVATPRSRTRKSFATSSIGMADCGSRSSPGAPSSFEASRKPCTARFSSQRPSDPFYSSRQPAVSKNSDPPKNTKADR